MARAYYPSGNGYAPWTADMVGAAPENHSHKTITDSGDGRNYLSTIPQTVCKVLNGAQFGTVVHCKVCTKIF